MKLINMIFCFSLVIACAPTITSNGPPPTAPSIASYGPTSANLRYIRNETVGGKLDFIKTLQKDYTHFNAGAKIYSKQGMALFMWGSAVHKLGVKSAELAIKLHEEIKGKTLKEHERKAIIDGFNGYND